MEPPVISLVRASVPNTLYNVNVSGTVTISVAGTPTVITFTPGSWIVDDINAMISNAFGGTPPVSFEYSSILNRYVCIFTQNTVVVTISSNDIATILGMAVDTALSGNIGTQLNGTSVPKLFPTGNYNISCDAVDDGMIVSNTQDRVIACFPLVGNRNQVSTYMPQRAQPFSAYRKQNGIQSIVFNVLGDDMESIDLHGSNWEVEISVTWVSIGDWS